MHGICTYADIFTYSHLVYTKRDLYIWKRDQYMRKEIHLNEKRPAHMQTFSRIHILYT